MSCESTACRASAILAITVPLACAMSSTVWAIATYLMVREKQRAQVEQARLEIKQQRNDNNKS